MLRFPEGRFVSGPYSTVGGCALAHKHTNRYWVLTILTFPASKHVATRSSPIMDWLPKLFSAKSFSGNPFKIKDGSIARMPQLKPTGAPGHG
jgi:hypothetical protein